MTADLSLPFTNRLRADLKAAMQARASEEATVLRALIGAVDNAQAVSVDPARKAYETVPFGEAAEVARKPLDEGALQQIIQRQIAEREAAAQEMTRVGRTDRADLLHVEAAIVARYLA